ncbi:MAG: winged helix-turn-helix transcriptional regulator [Desulfurococcaceae archaeon]
MHSDEKLVQLLETLASNPRMSIRELAAKTGLSYTYVWRKLNTLYSKELLSLSVTISSEVAGKEVAAVKIKSQNLEQFIDNLLNCNRIIVTFRANSNEVFMVVYGKDKHEIASIVETLKSKIGHISEVSMDYGILPERYMIPLKNNYLKCKPPSSCERCWLGSVNAAPKLLSE